MNRTNWQQAIILFQLCVILLISMAGALTFGTVSLPVGDIISAIYDSLRSGIPIDAPGQGPLHDIVWLLRMPRILMAACIGAGLATCGVIMQAIVKNPLADPYILGVSSGASLGATAAILLGFSWRKLCRDRCICWSLCDISRDCVHCKYGRACQRCETAACGHGTECGMQCIFEFHCLLRQ